MRRAFTLIELLVVIAIIAILAAILFPVFAQAKLAAKKAASISNVKQIGTSTMIYLADTDDVLPISRITLISGAGVATNDISYAQSDETLTTPSPATRAMWGNAINPYTKNRDITKSPVGTDLNLFGETEAQLGTQRFGYYYNGYLNSYSATAVAQPANTLLYSETAKDRQTRKWFFAWPLPYAGTSDATAPWQFNINANSTSWYGFMVDSTWFNYSRNQTVSYTDGHARALNTVGVDSYWTLTSTTGVPVVAFATPGANFKGYYIGGFWYKIAAPCEK